MTQTNIMQAVQNLVQPRAPRLKTFYDLVKPFVLADVFSKQNTEHSRHFLLATDGHLGNLNTTLEHEYKRSLKDELHWFMESNYRLS